MDSCVIVTGDAEAHAETAEILNPTLRAGLLSAQSCAFLNPLQTCCCKHDMFMYLPCWGLPKAHRLLAGKGVTARMEVQRGYWTVLKAASAKAAA